MFPSGFVVGPPMSNSIGVTCAMDVPSHVKKYSSQSLKRRIVQDGVNS